MVLLFLFCVFFSYFFLFCLFFFFNDTATTEIYTLSLHDALPIARDVPTHGDPVDREIGRRDDVRPVLEQRPVAPEQPFELRDAEPSAEPAEQDELLRPRDRRGRVHLDLTQASHHVLDRRWSGGVEELAHHGEV